VFGKEVFVSRRRSPSIGILRLLAPFVVLFVATFSVHALDYAYSTAELAALAHSVARDYDLERYEIPGPEGSVTGISLLELLPLMGEVHRLTIETAGGTETFRDGELGDEWGEAFFIPADTDGTPALLHRGDLYGDLRGISFSGEPLDADGLEVWLSWEGTEELEELIRRLARRHGIAADVDSVPGTEAKLAAQARARGAVPDLVMIQSSGVQTLVDTRAIQALDYLEIPNLIPQGRSAFTLEGRRWAVPFYFDTQVAFFNRSLYRRLPDRDWTLAGMEDLGRSLLRSGVEPMAWNAYSSNWLIPFQISWGKPALVDRDGGITTNDRATLTSLRYILRLQDEGILVPMERDAMDARFIAGEIGMIFSGSYAIPYFESLGLDIAVRPYPINQETGRRLSPLLDFKGFVIPRRTQNPVLARRFLQYLTGPGVQLRFCRDLYKLSVREDLRATLAEQMRYGDVLDQTIDTGTVIPPDRIYGVYKNTMWSLLRFALTRRMTPEETLTRAQELMDADR